jgi:ribosomal protein L18
LDETGNRLRTKGQEITLGFDLGHKMDCVLVDELIPTRSAEAVRETGVRTLGLDSWEDCKRIEASAEAVREAGVSTLGLES